MTTDRVQPERVTAPTWSSVPEAVSVVVHRPHLRMSLTTAVVVGTMLFAINQLDVVLAGDADLVVALKIALTYVVPFCVANVGMLTATRRRAG